MSSYVLDGDEWPPWGIRFKPRERSATDAHVRYSRATAVAVFDECTRQSTYFDYIRFASLQPFSAAMPLFLNVRKCGAAKHSDLLGDQFDRNTVR